MLEEIHATPEDGRKTRTFVALGLVGFALYALADAALIQWTGVTTLGVGAGATGAAMLTWLRAHHGPAMQEAN
jgi:hypothetical protein